MIRCLVTGAGGGIGQGLIKALRLIDDLPIEIIAADMSAKSAGLYSADQGFLVPAVSDNHYFSAVQALCQQHEINYYFPGTDLELLLCAEHRETLQQKTGTTLVVSAQDAISIADDKYRTYQFLKHHNLAHPKTWLANEIDSAQLSFPLIVKPRVGCRSIGVTLVHERQQLTALISDNPELMIQEAVGTADQEYTCTVAATANHRAEPVILKRQLRAGDTYQATPERNSVIAQYVKDIACHLAIEGAANFQLRLDNGVPKLFEINCRFSGTTPFCAKLGANPVEFYLKTHLGLPYQAKVNYQATVLRYWQELVVSNEQLTTISGAKLTDSAT